MALVKTLLNGNEVEYDDTEFEILKDEEDSISYLHYIGNGEAVRNPRGNTSCYKMFYYCKLKSLDLSNFDTSNVTNMRSMFRDCYKIKVLDLSNFDTSNVTNMGSMFRGCESLKELDLSHFDTSNVTIMGAMFYHCCHLIKLDLSNFDTSNVTSMWAMFHYCYSLIKLDLSNFDTSSVTTMQGMFYHCRSLIELDLSNFDTSSVTSMENMFEGCESLKELDLSHFKMSQVEASSMFNIPKRSSMFKDCQSLISLNLSGFDTVISSMFDGCTSLSSLDLSNLSKLYLVPMFLKCNNLENIVFKRLDILSYSVEDLKFIFEGCPYLDKLLAMKKQRPINRSGSSTSNPVVGTASGILMPSEAYMGIDDLFLDLLEDLKTADERDTLKKLRNKGIKDSDFVGILSVAKPDSEMINTYCDRVIIPAIKDLFKLNKDGRSSLTVGDVFKKIAAQHGNGLAAIALVRFLSDEYLVE